jgi:hypothetical protein
MKIFLMMKSSFSVSCKNRKRKEWIYKINIRSYSLYCKTLIMRRMEMTTKNKLLQRGKDNTLDTAWKQIINKRFWPLVRVQDSLSRHSKKDRINQLKFIVSLSLILRKRFKNKGVHHKKITLYSSNNRVKLRVAIAEIPLKYFKIIWYSIWSISTKK